MKINANGSQVPSTLVNISIFRFTTKPTTKKSMVITKPMNAPAVCSGVVYVYRRK